MTSQTWSAPSCNILMTIEGKEKVKFLSVPNTFSNENIKHADLLGIYYIFRDGQTWLILDEKRLFRKPDSDEDRTDETANDYPKMSPEKLD